MENRIYIFIFWRIPFFLSGEGFAMVTMTDAIKKEGFGFQKIDWSVLYEKIAADSQVPDQRDVLMLLDYHRSDSVRCESLLRRFNGGKAYHYIASRILPELSVPQRKRPPTMAVREAKPVYGVETARPLPGKLAGGEPVMVNREKSAMESEKVRRQTALAVKNNLLYDLASALNIEVEIPLGKRWSLNIGYKCPWRLNSREELCYQLLSGGVEGRCQLGDRRKHGRLTGHFLGRHTEGGIYDFQLKGDGYQGKHYATSGITYGYARQVACHLSFEFSVGVGYLTTEYRKYTPCEGSLAWTNSGRYNFIGPTRTKVSLVWFITARRQRWMKDIGQLLSVLFCPLLLMTGCSRRELLDDYPVSGVQVALNWEGVTEKLPEGTQVIFYPKDERGKKKSVYLSVTDGEVPVPPGHYSVVVYNYDTGTVLIRRGESYETIQTYTNLCKFGVAGTEKMVWGPDLLYAIDIDDLDARNSEEALTLELKLRLVARTYSFSIEAQGLSNVSTVIGSVSGMADRYFLGKGYAMCDVCPINIDLNVKAGKIEGAFTAFELPGAVINRAETEPSAMMNLMIIKVDKSVQEVKINITEAAQEPTGGGEGGKGDKTEPPTLAEAEVENEVKVDDVEVLPGRGGGIDGDVGDWDDETDVELSVG